MEDTQSFTESEARELLEGAADRMELWQRFVSSRGSRTMAEVGVYRGAFAAHLLDACPSLERYYMIDPWRHLDGWNKPANKADDVFERYFEETMQKTALHADRRVVLRGRTVDVASQLPDEQLDLVYVDGDHTLRGVTVDLLRLYPKVRPGGFIGGDDFCRSIFQHDDSFEPTLVFPFAVYFAEAVGARIYALPFRQFLLQKSADDSFSFVDLTGRYDATTLKEQLASRAPKPRPAPAAEAPASPTSPMADVLGSLRRRLVRAVGRAD